jgi:hypothetical protein
MTDRIVLFGENCVGKTAATVTPLLANVPNRRLVYLALDNNCMIGVDNGLAVHKIIPKEGELIYIEPAHVNSKVTNFLTSLETFQNQTASDARRGDSKTTLGKEKYTFLLDSFKNLDNFIGTDYATGKQIKLGNAGKWDTNTILIVDGLSVIGEEVWNSTTGHKILKGKDDYMPASALMLKALSMLTELPCHLILNAHQTYEHKEVKGENNQVSIEVVWEALVQTTVGVKSYSSLMGLFSEVVQCYKQGVSFKMRAEDSIKPKVRISRRKIPAGSLPQDLSKYGLFEKE